MAINSKSVRDQQLRFFGLSIQFLHQTAFSELLHKGASIKDVHTLEEGG